MLTPMPILSFALFIILLLSFVYVLWRSKNQAKTPPSRAWKGETVTPVILGPRNRAPERVARMFVVSQGALLAFRMAEIDGEICSAERDAVRSFVLTHVTQANEALADKAMAEAEARLGDPEEVDRALEGLRAVSSPAQQKLLLDLLMHVAHANGSVDPEEVEFMRSVGERLGLSSAESDEWIGEPQGGESV